MKTRFLSVLLAGAMLLGTLGELAPAALAVEETPTAEDASAVQETAVNAQSISIHPNVLWLRAGEQTQLTASVLPDGAEGSVIWRSSDPQVCSVSDSGTVTAQSDGTTTLSAQIDTLTASCTVHVGLNAPSVFNVVIDADQHASLSWKAVPNCDGYRVSRRVSDTDEWQDVATLTGTTWTDTSISAQSDYQYAVRAYKLRNSQTDDPETIWSDYSHTNAPVIEQAASPESISKPAAPVLISAEALTSGGIRVKWQPVSGSTGYRVYRKNGSEWELIRVIKGASTTSYIDTTVASGTSYTYTVSAFARGGGKILYSDYNTTGVSATSIAILAPQLGTVTSGGYDRVTVTWNATAKAEGYVIYRRTSASEAWQSLATITSGSTTSYIDTTVTCGITYFYTVCAYCTVNGTKVYSGYNDTGISGRAVPAMPALGSASSAGSTSIKITWSAVSGAQGYYIYRKTSASANWTYLTYTATGSTTSFTDTGLTTGQRYYYTVSAFRRISGNVFCSGAYNSTGISAVPTAVPYGNVYASYSTSYSASNANRTTNLNIACKTINGTIVKPGATFSFNGTLGERTSAKGYKPATIFTGATGTAQEIGGGICQVASTMFNTALLANVTITERYPHSQKVTYCPLGRDAGIYYGSKNFRFTNNTKYNIQIKSWISGGTLTVQFLTTEQVKPPAVNLTVTYSGGTYTLKRSVNGTVNYTAKSRYG